MARAGPGRSARPGGGSSPTGPKNASNTRRSGSTWASAVTSVASAHRYSWYRVAGRATVTAAANRWQRAGSAGTPAPRSAAPNRAASSARSSVTIAGRGREPCGPEHLQVF